MTPVELVAIIKRHEAAWLALPGVRGVGGSLCGDDGWIVVYADRPEIEGIPESVGGVRVQINCARLPLEALA